MSRCFPRSAAPKSHSDRLAWFPASRFGISRRDLWSVSSRETASTADLPSVREPCARVRSSRVQPAGRLDVGCADVFWVRS